MPLARCGRLRRPARRAWPAQGRKRSFLQQLGTTHSPLPPLPWGKLVPVGQRQRVDSGLRDESFRQPRVKRLEPRVGIIEDHDVTHRIQVDQQRQRLDEFEAIGSDGEFCAQP